MNEHRILKDYAGWGGHERLTCLSCARTQIQGVTLLCYPYYSQEQWEAKVTEWLQLHPDPEFASKHNIQLVSAPATEGGAEQ